MLIPLSIKKNVIIPSKTGHINFILLKYFVNSVPFEISISNHLLTALVM